MILSLVSWKGGCGKTTSSIHLAALLAGSGSTMLIDEDRSRNATNWAARGEGVLPFRAYPPRALGSEARKHEHIVIDTRGGLEDQDLVDLYDNSDLIVVPAVAESMTLEALVNTVHTLEKHGRSTDKLRVLFTMARRASGKADKVGEAKAAVSEPGPADAGGHHPRHRSLQGRLRRRATGARHQESGGQAGLAGLPARLRGADGMTGRFAGLRSMRQELEDTTPATQPQTVTENQAPQTSSNAPTDPAEVPTLTATPERPWEAATAPTEPVKALNGRVPRSVRLAFDRQLTDAMDALRIDVTVDLAVEALARLVVEQPEVRERWLRRLWELKRRG